MRRLIIQNALAVAARLLAACCFIGGALGPSITEAGTIRTDRDDQLYLDLAAQPEFASVGRFTWNESGGGFLASGTLIRDNYVLTAAHVVDGTNGFGAGISNLEFELGGETYEGVEWIPHPAWAPSGGESNLFAGWDIGLVRLDRSVDNVDPAQLFTDRNELGQVATISGFGATGTGETGAVIPGGTRRAGQNVIDAVGPTATPGSVIAPPTDRLITIDFDNPNNPGDSTLGSSQPLDLEYLTAPGDSGGGLFLEVDGQQLLAGVTSLGSSTDGDGANSDYGDRASFTRVSSFLDFIESIIGPEPEPLAGDLNGDGIVDGADFVVARDLGLEPDEIGVISSEFGSSSLSTAGLSTAGLSTAGLTAGAIGIPEPSGLLIGVTGFLALVFATRPHRNAGEFGLA